jgi:hypothetical protein
MPLGVDCHRGRLLSISGSEEVYGAVAKVRRDDSVDAVQGEEV